jgi:CRISPR-associated exonuclease Cas4
MTIPLLIIFLLMALGLAALIGGWRMRLRSGLPGGEIIYSDTRGWQMVAKPLLSHRYGLVGKPDYLVKVREWRRTITVPVEVKSGKRPPTLLEAHVLQLAVYCLLVEEHFQRTPPYGLLRYADATLKIPFTEQLRAQVLEVAEAIRRGRGASDISRSHQEPGRCQRCGYRPGCGAQVLGVEATANLENNERATVRKQ